MAMYHSWGSQNAWLRQIHAANRLFINRETALARGLADDDWVWVISHHGRIKAQIRLMEGVSPDTVWTWNAIGKRRGARSEEHTSELQSLMRISYAVFCLKKKKRKKRYTSTRYAIIRTTETCITLNNTYTYDL